MIVNLKTLPVCLALFAAAADFCPAQQAEPGEGEGTLKKREPTRFLRILRDEFDEPTALQTATAKYILPGDEGEPKLEVVLESVIHIADRSYFRAFNQRFRHYDAVLYELVAPPEKRVPDPNSPAAHPIALLQQLAASSLGLTHQVQEIDYQPANMIHADLSPQEMAQAMKERGDDAFTMMADTLLHWIRQSNRVADSDEPSPPPAIDLSALTEPGGSTKVRRLLAEQFAESARVELALPPRQRAALIDDRNGRCMAELQRQLDVGQRRIALFWGAGHMEDLERRLLLDYGLQPAGVIWRNAWDLRSGAVERTPLEAILEKSLRGLLKDAAELIPPE